MSSDSSVGPGVYGVGRGQENIFPTLPDGAPAGKLVLADDPTTAPDRVGWPLLWISDEPVEHAGEAWSRLFEQHRSTGLYPLMLEVTRGDRASGSDFWDCSTHEDAIDELDANTELAAFWDRVRDDAQERWPSGPWPGLARASAAVADSTATARCLAEQLETTQAGRTRRWRLGLVPASRGADALTVAGWSGPLNYTPRTERISVVVRSWEDRFGVRLVGLDINTLTVSVSAPPQDMDHARTVAMEHFAICPDSLWQGRWHTFDEYAQALVGSSVWTFWWD